MIVIRKKRLILIISLVCISLTTIMVSNSMKYNNVVETVNLPVSNKVIVVDAGHRCS